MIRRKFIVALIVTALGLPGLPVHAGSREGRQMTASAGPANRAGSGRAWDFTAMPRPGEKVRIGSGHYLVFGFDQKPKMGTVIMKIQVYDDRGEKDTSLAITADSWMPSMPSMRGGHEIFRISKKGDYLVPVDITMPGDWEIKLTIVKDGKIIFRGSHKFDV